jgi:hypothetical protein
MSRAMVVSKRRPAILVGAGPGAARFRDRATPTTSVTPQAQGLPDRLIELQHAFSSRTLQLFEEVDR